MSYFGLVDARIRASDKDLLVKNTQNPIWSENEFVFLLDTPNGHKIKVDFYDEDALSRDSYLGYGNTGCGIFKLGVQN